MKIILSWLVVMLSAACVLTGCQSPKAGFPSGNSASTRNNCYSLLHQLLDEQKDVSLLRFIKSEHADVKKLVKRIATTSGTGAKLLEKFYPGGLAKMEKDWRAWIVRGAAGVLGTR